MTANPKTVEGSAAAAATIEPAGGRPPRLLRLPEVMDRVGLRRSAIYQRMSEGRFPKSRTLGARCSVWVEAEINDWIDAIARQARIGTCRRQHPCLLQHRTQTGDHLEAAAAATAAGDVGLGDSRMSDLACA